MITKTLVFCLVLTTATFLGCGEDDDDVASSDDGSGGHVEVPGDNHWDESNWDSMKWEN